MRIDLDLKKVLSQDLPGTRTVATGEATAKADGVSKSTFKQWGSRRAVAAITAGWRFFDNRPGVHHLAEDSTKLGHPSEETTCYELLDAASRVAIFLPQQAPAM